MARSSPQTPVSPVSLLPAFTAFKKGVKEHMLQEEEEIRQKLQELTESRALLKKNGTSEDVIDLLQQKILALTAQKNHILPHAEKEASARSEKIVRTLTRKTLIPSVDALRDALTIKKARRPSLEAYARLPPQHALLLKAVRILERFKKKEDAFIPHILTPSKQKKSAEESLESTLREAYAGAKRFTSLTSNLTHLFKAWGDVMTGAPPDLEAAEQDNIKKLPAEYSQAIQECINSGRLLVLTGLDQLSEGDPEAALYYFTSGARHWDLVPALCKGPTLSSVTNHPLPHAQFRKVMEKIREEGDISRLSKYTLHLYFESFAPSQGKPSAFWNLCLNLCSGDNQAGMDKPDEIPSASRSKKKGARPR